MKKCIEKTTNLVFDAACFDPRTCDKMLFMTKFNIYEIVTCTPSIRVSTAKSTVKKAIFIAFKIWKIGPQGRRDLTTNRIVKSLFEQEKTCYSLRTPAVMCIQLN